MWASGLGSNTGSQVRCYCCPGICLMLFVKTLGSCTTELVQCYLQPGVLICLVSWGQVQTCSIWLRYPWLQGSWLLVVGTRMTHDLEAENGHNCFFLPVLPNLAHSSEWGLSLSPVGLSVCLEPSTYPGCVQIRLHTNASCLKVTTVFSASSVPLWTQ